MRNSLACPLRKVCDSQAVDGVITNYTLDLARGLTQVLSDGTSTYLLGLGRVGEQGAEWQVHLGDPLGNVRQLAGADGSVLFAQSYAPYGSVLSSRAGYSSRSVRDSMAPLFGVAAGCQAAHQPLSLLRGT